MTVPPPAVADPNPPSRPTVIAGGRGIGGALAAGIGSGALLYLAHPTVDRGFTAWFALVPLLSLVGSQRPNWVRYLAAWLGGLTFWVPSLVWIWELHPTAWLPWLALATYQSLFWPLFLVLARLMTGRFRLPLMLAAPIAWVGLEYLQSFALTGFPWYYLAHSQSRYLPIIQIADLGGAWLVSLLVMMANAFLLELLIRPLYRTTPAGPKVATGFALRAGAMALALGGTLLYGGYRLNQAVFVEGPRVAILQSSIPQELKASSDPAQIIARYGALIRRAAATAETGPPIALYIWPETSFAGGAVRIEPGLSEDQIDRAGKALYPGTKAADWSGREAVVTRDVTEWARDLKSAMLVGSLLHDLGPSGGERSNAALLFDPESPTPGPAVYRKIHLVPFGEYVPLVERFPWITRLTPYENEALPTLRPGSGPVMFDVRGVRYAPIICFEDTVPDLARLATHAMAGGPPADVLVAISNDGWFRGSAEHDVHLANSVFRAVENRIPLVRSVNSGISAVVNGNGRIVASLPKLQEAALVETVPLDPRSSLYGQIGDSVGQACFAVSLGLSLLALTGYRPRSSRPTAGPAPIA